ncbi:MAG: hypothetical protein LC437_03735, partial [Thiohalomonas sp.]|nr:hypothetical protein [Thiohalomonas sp.]
FMGCESNLRHWIFLIFFSMKIKHFHRSWVYNREVLYENRLNICYNFAPITFSSNLYFNSPNQRIL